VPRAPCTESRIEDNNFSNRRPHPGGLTHDNTRHTARFTVIGNHLAQHRELSLLAIGFGVHLQSLPKGARVDVKSLAARFPEGAPRIADALRELEVHGYLRRERERTPVGRIITRTTSCNQPAAARRHSHQPAEVTGQAQTARETQGQRAPRQQRTPRKPLPTVPSPAYPAPALLQMTTDLLADLRRHDSGLLLSACDAAHLAPGVAAWLERDVSSSAVRHALTVDLPPDGLRRPAAFLAHRLTAQLPPAPPFRAPAGPPPVIHEMRNCDGCDRGFRAAESGARCRDCRSE
jgi:hypothetical protein